MAYEIRFVYNRKLVKRIALDDEQRDRALDFMANTEGLVVTEILTIPDPE